MVEAEVHNNVIQFRMSEVQNVRTSAMDISN